MKWIVRILGALLVVVCVAVLAIYVASNRIINQRHAFHEHPLTVPSDSASVAEGARFARIRCMGCHGDSLKGKVFFDAPMIARLIAPNVPAKLATLSGVSASSPPTSSRCATGPVAKVPTRSPCR